MTGRDITTKRVEAFECNPTIGACRRVTAVYGEWMPMDALEDLRDEYLAYVQEACPDDWETIISYPEAGFSVIERMMKSLADGEHIRWELVKS